MTAEIWTWDDPEIVPGTTFLRRMRNKPEFIVRDLITDAVAVQPAALVFDEDGMSVHGVDRLAEIGVARDDACDPVTHAVVEFEVDAVRDGGGGIVWKVDPDDERMGPAHALVRTPTSSLPRGEKKKIREKIAATCRIVPQRGDSRA